MIDASVRGVDVSSYQGSIDWRAAADDGIRFAMIKASQGRSVYTPSLYLFEDSRFRANVTGAAAAGIACGAYHYLTALTKEEAVREADFFLSVTAAYRTKLPLGAAVDVEDSRLSGDRTQLGAVVRAFCARVEAAGMEIMVYTNPDFLRNRIDSIGGRRLWLALWRTPSAIPQEKDYPGLRIWQWGVRAVNGIPGTPDADFGDAALLAPTAEEPDYAAEVCRIAGLSEATRAYLAQYRYSADLFYKLYRAMCADASPAGTKGGN